MRAYADMVAGFNPPGAALTAYPGSPAIAARLMRATDRLVLIEAHPAEHEALRQVFRRDRRAHVHRRDAFEALPALLPPAEHRGLVLIDPSYEVKTDYPAVPALVDRSLRRWPTGIYVVWYPLLPDARHAPLVAGLEALARPLLRAELTGPPRDRGLIGTGLAVINPPWKFAETLATAGAELAHILFGTAGKHILQAPE